ncbi:MAG: hypothetical protein Q8N14_07150, partial [Candidatus Omnitrophota bacterium]|nr:hypothetical protein [Candidatus Omnitrophota bacterium]
IFSLRIAPKAVLTLIFRGSLFKKKNLRFVFSLLKSIFKGEMRRLDCSKEFPAHLHINVNDSSRQLGTGIRLMERYLDYLKSNNIGGVHLYSFSSAGKQFFQKLGFNNIYAQKISYFDYLGKKGLQVSCFAKRLK